MLGRIQRLNYIISNKDGVIHCNSLVSRLKIQCRILLIKISGVFQENEIASDSNLVTSPNFNIQFEFRRISNTIVEEVEIS